LLTIPEIREEVIAKSRHGLRMQFVVMHVQEGWHRRLRTQTKLWPAAAAAS
jgi:hypothetical protein